VGSVSDRLASATSPYLLQHADNPVHLWEWGETFTGAREGGWQVPAYHLPADRQADDRADTVSGPAGLHH
jgi:hypothetical protein